MRRGWKPARTGLYLGLYPGLYPESLSDTINPSGINGSSGTKSPAVKQRLDSMIDLRSDTVTTPCDNMRRAMVDAVVG